ncbi:hypothetical protein SAMN05877962_12744 [Alloalcanivorax xenomutans]|uniref:hypothetical protein n=1 Tax=Alloalcanivorax xenomutans TaxID=1094342 RepID=UPI000BCB0430|nr:hypothetical protein [Alloalcanivorax xenomutans]SOC26980.1 hypothetical protein SAMN05877962_12744 [Alloalcanivorax xenomutans]
MLAWLKRWFHRPPSAPPEEDSGAAHAGDEPEDLHRGRHRLKERYTSHWDLDYLSQEDLDELLGDDDDKDRPGSSNRR